MDLNGCINQDKSSYDCQLNSMFETDGRTEPEYKNRRSRWWGLWSRWSFERCELSYRKWLSYLGLKFRPMPVWRRATPIVLSLLSIDCWFSDHFSSSKNRSGSRKFYLDWLTAVDVIDVAVIELGWADDGATALFRALNFDVDRRRVVPEMVVIRPVPLRSVDETDVLHFLLQ